MDIFSGIWDWLSDTLSAVLSWVLLLLPDSPFQALNNSVIGEYMGLINWFFPFSFVISTMQLWLSAIAIYYAISAILRWVKAIE